MSQVGECGQLVIGYVCPGPRRGNTISWLQLTVVLAAGGGVRSAGLLQQPGAGARQPLSAHQGRGAILRYAGDIKRRRYRDGYIEWEIESGRWRAEDRQWEIYSGR
jgi:hypothetical protein